MRMIEFLALAFWRRGGAKTLHAREHSTGVLEAPVWDMWHSGRNGVMEMSEPESVETNGRRCSANHLGLVGRWWVPAGMKVEEVSGLEPRRSLATRPVKRYADYRPCC